MESVVLWVYIALLSVLLIYSIEALYLSMKFKKHFVDVKKNHTKTDFKNNLPLVTVQLPIFNEKYVVERLLKSIVALDYPKHLMEIQVLDDSTDETKGLCERLVEAYKNEGFDICHIHRVDRSGFKAGALKESLDRAKGRFIAIFDADFLPRPDFLKETISYFSEENVGLVQTRWEHINKDYSMITKAQAVALDGHFVVEQTARNLSGYFINFNGTAGVWRKETIIDAGNWEADTITEDLDLSFRAQLKGWKFKYITDYHTPSELPVEINALKSQQYRWTKGAVETAKKLLPSVWKSDLPIKTKLQCTYHLTNNLVYLAVFFIALLNLPLIYIKTHSSEYDMFFLVLSIFSVSFLGPFFMFYYSQKTVYENWKSHLASFPVFLSGSMGLTVNNGKAVIDGILGKKSPFIRTPKFNIFSSKDDFSTRSYKAKLSWVVIVEILMTLYSFCSLSIAIINVELAAIPFHFMFFFGFLSISYLTVKHHFRYATIG